MSTLNLVLIHANAVFAIVVLSAAATYLVLKKYFV